jgi:hypothetical protein
MIIPPQQGFSASVSLTLLVDGQPVEVAQLGPRSIFLREPAQEITQKPATLIIEIGQSRETQQIVLSGVSPNDPREVFYW